MPRFGHEALTTQRLIYFLRLAKESSFRRAAESVNLSTSAFTKHINMLEATLHLQLFVRDPRGARLTSTGRQLLPYAESAVGKMARLTEFADALSQGSEGLLSIACYPVHIERFLGTVIEQFLQRNPNVQLDLTQMRDDRRRNLGRSLFDELLDREVDLAMGPPHTHLRGITGFQAYVARIVALVPDEHDARHKPTISIADLAKSPVLTAPEGYFSRRKLESAAHDARVTLTIGAQSSSPPALMVLGKSGLGVPALPDDYPLVGQQNAPYPIVTDASGIEICTPVWLQWRDCEPLTAAAASFAEIGKEVVGHEQEHGRIRQNYYSLSVD